VSARVRPNELPGERERVVMLIYPAAAGGIRLHLDLIVHQKTTKHNPTKHHNPFTLNPAVGRM
jgi:hypothetical protein